MKGKFFFFAAAALAMVTSCASDEMVDANPGNAINFSVTAGRQTRAAATTTTSIQNFKVWAFTSNDAKTFMDGLEVDGPNPSWTYTGTKFWPEDALDFFAVSPKTVNANVAVDENEKKVVKTIENYTANGQEDLLYAANFGETKAAHEVAPVAVNFRHALSQVVFNLGLSENSTIDVEVKSIKVNGVTAKGTFYWGTKSTTDQLADNDGKADTETDDSWGKWVSDSSQDSMYEAFNLEKPIDIATGAEDFNKSANNYSLFLLPQTLNPWTPVDNGNGSFSVTGTARIIVTCRVTDKKSGLQLWPAAGKDFADVTVTLDNPKNDPFAADGKHNCWMQGKKYIYTLIFGEGAGYIEDITDPNHPKPVLVPIKFAVTVDEFQNGAEYSVDYKVK